MEFVRKKLIMGKTGEQFTVLFISVNEENTVDIY